MRIVLRTLMLAVLLALLLRPVPAAAATDADIDTLMRYYAYLAGEPLTAAETATIRQATIELFTANPAVAANRLARATRNLGQAPTAREIDEPLRSMAIASIGLDSMAPPDGPDSRVFPILNRHFDHAQAAPPPAPQSSPAAPQSTPTPTRAPALPQPAPVAPTALPPARPPPAQAQIDSIIATAEWIIGGAFPPEQKEKVRAMIVKASDHPSFRSFVDRPPVDIGALYRRPAAEQASRRDELLFGPQGLYLVSRDMAGLDDPDGDKGNLAALILGGYEQNLAAAGLTDEQLAQVIRGAEAMMGGKLLPAEAAAIQAALRARFRVEGTDVMELVGTARAMTIWTAAHTDAEIGDAFQPFYDEMRRAVGDGKFYDYTTTPELLAGFKASIAAYDRLHPAKADSPFPRLLPSPAR